MIHLILLSGGSGTRLWPLSNNTRSKQFLKVLRDNDGNHISMVQRVFSQLQQVPAATSVTIATTSSQQYSIESQISGDYALVLEPERRDTAPAIMLACKHLLSEQNASTGDSVIVMPIDSFADQAYYDKIIELDSFIQLGCVDLVLLGVEPTYPSTKYGYIVPSKSDGSGIQQVEEFKEKPDEKTAQALIERGGLWNCGVFGFKLGYLDAITRSYCNAETFADLCARYGELPKNSFDYEVVERVSGIGVLSYSGVWKDLGTWNTLSEEMADCASGRVIGVNSTCKNTHVINELGIPMVVTGINDSVVVATHDGILVAEKDSSSTMKPLVERVAESRPMYEQRRWGQYRVLDSNAFQDGSRTLVTELIINDGCQLSYQVHRYRREVWTVTCGAGEVVLDGRVRPISAGSVIDIPLGVMHACRAFDTLHLVEVQLGDLLEEADIERYGDYWDE